MSCFSVRNSVISDFASTMKQAYHFTIHHKPGVTYQNADALSRHLYEQLTPEIMAFMKTLPCTLKWNFFMTILQQCLALPAFLLQISLKFSQLIPLQEKQVMWTVFYLSIQAFFESLPCQTYPNYKKNAMTTNQ